MRRNEEGEEPGNVDGAQCGPPGSAVSSEVRASDILSDLEMQSKRLAELMEMIREKIAEVPHVDKILGRKRL